MASEITVVGGGIFGLATAWELVRRGARVRLIEADRIGAGSSGGTVGALAPHAPDSWNAKKAMQRDALVAAESWWAEITAAGGVDSGYGRTGRIQPIAADADLGDRIAASKAHWRGFHMWRTAEPAGVLLPASPEGIFLQDDFTARIAPRRAVAALAAAIRAAGGAIEEGAGPQRPDDLRGTVIWATGVAGLLSLTEDLGRRIGTGVKGQSAVLEFAAPNAPQVFADGVHIVPHGDGTVGIGSTSENMFEYDAPDDLLDGVIARARAICPDLRFAPVLARWAGIRPRAQSRAPLIGQWPGRDGHFVLNGGFKIGFGMAPLLAVRIADLVLTGRCDAPEGFRL